MIGTTVFSRYDVVNIIRFAVEDGFSTMLTGEVLFLG
jgi:hypothetical protein